MTKKLKVKLVDRVYRVRGKHTHYMFDSVTIKSANKSRVYFRASMKGLSLVTIAKQIKCENGEAYVKFGKEKVVIGSYVEC